MTDPAPDGSGDTIAGGTSRWFTVALNAVGVVIVASFLVRQGLLAQPVWIAALTSGAILAWLLRAVTLGSASATSLLAAPGEGARASRWELAGTIAAVVAVVLGSVVAVPTAVLGYLPALVCIGALISSPRRPLLLGLGLALASLLIVSVAVLASAPVPSSVLLGAGAGLLVSVLVGISRREYRTSALRQRELIDDRLRLADEREHAAALAERSRIARDIHDVLAHSLGGLVLQLDAVDALLESGDTRDAHSRVLAARALAASGLDEARRAVDALRDPDAAADLPAALAELVATHHALGGQAELQVSGEPRPLSSDAAGALRRAAQELLSNARRHAPGEPTRLALLWTRDAVTLTATTPLAPGARPTSPGGGRGLSGLRERVSGLGGSATWSAEDGVFSVTAVVPGQAHP